VRAGADGLPAFPDGRYTGAAGETLVTLEIVATEAHHS